MTLASKFVSASCRWIPIESIRNLPIIDQILLYTILTLPALDMLNGILKHSNLPAIAQAVKFIILALMTLRIFNASALYSIIILLYSSPLILSDCMNTIILGDNKYTLTDLGNTTKNASLIISYIYLASISKHMAPGNYRRYVYAFMAFTLAICAGNIAIGSIGFGYPQYKFFLPNGEPIHIGTIGYFYEGNTLGALLILSAIPFIIIAHKKGALHHIFTSLALIVLSIEKATKAAMFGAIIVIISPICLHFRLKFGRIKISNLIIPILLTIGLSLSLPFAFKKFSESTVALRLTTMANNVDLSTLIFSDRNLFLKIAIEEFYDDPSTWDVVFGKGYKSTEAAGDGTNIENKTIEIDFFDILFEKGMIGALFSFAFWIYLAANSMTRLVNCRSNTIVESCFIANLLFIALSFLSGHIVGSGVISFYFSVLNAYSPENENQQCKGTIGINNDVI